MAQHTAPQYIYVPPTPPYYEIMYELSSIVATVDITTPIDTLVRPGGSNWMVDVLDQRFVDLLESVTAWHTVMWTGGKMTTFSYLQYGVQNMWFIILTFNGLSSPLQLRPGMWLRVPAKVQIDAYLKTLAAPPKSRTGMITI